MVINSTKGPNGGFEIDKTRLSKTSIHQIVQAIDGNHLFEDCVLGLNSCNANEPCPMHNEFVNIQKQLMESLATSNLLDVAMDLNLGLTVLKR